MPDATRHRKITIVRYKVLSTEKVLVVKKVGRKFSCFITTGKAPRHLARESSIAKAYAAFEEYLTNRSS